MTSTKSTYWGPPMSESQYAVFHFDVKTMSMRDAKGDYLSAGNDAPLIFDNFEDASKYCQGIVASKPAMGCRIYDHKGRVVQTFSDEQVYDRHHGLPAAKRNIAIGGACLALGISGVALDASLGWSLTFGVLIGVRFLWVGTMRMAEGIAGWRDQRPVR